jgi:glycerol-3-phosphate dehydrogenase (NAD(P)+)
MRVTVLGAGSWGTTVAALLCRRDHEVLLWARNPEVAAEVDGQRSNEAYLPGVRLPARLGTPSCWWWVCRPRRSGRPWRRSGRT